MPLPPSLAPSHVISCISCNWQLVERESERRERMMRERMMRERERCLTPSHSSRLNSTPRQPAHISFIHISFNPITNKPLTLSPISPTLSLSIKLLTLPFFFLIIFIFLPTKRLQLSTFSFLHQISWNKSMEMRAS